MKKLILVGALSALVSAGAMAQSEQNNQLFYPASAQTQPHPQGKTRAQVKQELIQSEKSGELKRLDSTLYEGR